MRTNLDAAFHKGLLAVVDIGHAKISCAILRLNASAPYGSSTNLRRSMATTFRVIGHAQIDLGPVEADRQVGSVKLRSAILSCLSRAYRMAGEAAVHVFVCYSGKDPKSEVFHGSIELGSDIIGDRQVADVLGSCEIPAPRPSRHVLHAQPIGFSVDHRAGFEDPRGEKGNRLSVDLHYVTVDRADFERLVEVLLDCRLKIAGISATALASGVSALVDNEMQSGSVIVDIGASATNVAAFFLSQMLYCGSIGIGGARISADVCEAFGLPFSVAERLKLAHGGVGATYQDERVIYQRAGRGAVRTGSNVGITRSDLIAVIRPRVEEIFECVHYKLSDRGWETGTNHQIVFTGGCCEIRGFADLARDVFQASVRIGKPVQIAGLPSAMTRPANSSLVGLCILITRPPDELWDYNVELNTRPGKTVGKVSRWANWVYRNW